MGISFRITQVPDGLLVASFSCFKGLFSQLAGNTSNRLRDSWNSGDGGVEDVVRFRTRYHWKAPKLEYQCA